MLKVRTEGIAEVKSQIKSLQGAEKEAAEARVAGMEAGNSAIKSWITNLGIAGTAIAAVKLGLDGLEALGHRLDLEATTAGLSIEGLRKASKGLTTDIELMEHAAKLSSGTFKLNQSQLETVEKAMYQLKEQGKDSTEVWSAMEAALTKGSIKPLMSLGIVIHDTGNLFDENGGKLDSYAKRQQALGEILDGVTDIAKGAESAQLDQADAVEVNIVKLKNYWEQAKEGLGQVLVALNPIIAGLAASVATAGKLLSILSHMPGGGNGSGGPNALGVVGQIPGVSSGDVLGGAGSFFDWANKQVPDSTFEGEQLSPKAMLAKYIESYKAEQAARPLYATDPTAFGMSQAAGTVDEGAFYNFWDSTLSKYLQKKTASGGAGDKYRPGMYGKGAPLKGPYDGRLGVAAGEGGQQGGIQFIDMTAIGAQVDAANKLAELEEKTRSARYADFNHAKSQNALEQMFGPIESFNAYAKGFELLSGAVTTAMDAWIDGSVSAGEAIKKFIGTALKGLASQMAVEALKHGAYAIGSLAFGDVAGASTHAAAALAFASGAAAAAVAAKEMGGGGASVPKASGASATGGTGGGSHASSGGGSSSGGKQQPIINNFIVGDWFANQSLRERQREAERTVKLATGGSVGQDS